MINVPFKEKKIEEYAEYVSTDEMARIRDTARPLRGKRVLHLSSTPYGGGVAELLAAIVPLMNDLGLDTQWQVLERDDDFFALTKLLHNSLQGMGAVWTKEIEDSYHARNREYARSFSGSYDFVVVHDPQPAVIASLLEERGLRDGIWLWRCHLDLSTPDRDALRMISDILTSSYECAIFTHDSFVPADLEIATALIAPSIDPLSPKNMPLDSEVAGAAVKQYGVNPDLPFALQVSRFDPWKDPLGVIDAVLAARKDVPDLQLVFVGTMANDDPEGYHYYQKTAEKSAGLEGVRLLTNVDGIGNLGVNAFQTAANIVVQKSLREGFGLTVAEALWKGKPVIAGNVGGIPLQVTDGETGFLVSSVEECAERMVCLLQNPAAGVRMGSAGRHHVHKHFLTPRHLMDYLQLFTRLESGDI